MGPDLPGSLYFFVLKTFFFFLLVDFFPRGGCRIYQRGGGRCKHWPPGAGDPPYATASDPQLPHPHPPPLTVSYGSVRCRRVAIDMKGTLKKADFLHANQFRWPRSSAPGTRGKFQRDVVNNAWLPRVRTLPRKILLMSPLFLK